MKKARHARRPQPSDIDPNMSLADVPRNDLGAAERFYLSRDRKITGDEYRVLWHLQDHPKGFERISDQWVVVESRS